MSDATPLKHGDFTPLAEDYGRYRPGYSEFVLDAVLGLTGKPPGDVDFADVGAGTGIWTRMVASRGCRTVAVEPNEAMRRRGAQDSQGCAIAWQEGSAEATGLPSASRDLLSMASSFHWADYETAVREFHRVLRPGGVFTALWNTRFIEASPLLLEIEALLKRMVPTLKRVSSGRSEFCDTLHDRLRAHPCFSDVLCLEGRHLERQSKERYLGLWKSVNDVRVQAGEERFNRFLAAVEERIAGEECIDAWYLTRAWVARTAE